MLARASPRRRKPASSSARKCTTFGKASTASARPNRQLRLDSRKRDGRGSTSRRPARATPTSSEIRPLAISTREGTWRASALSAAVARGLESAEAGRPRGRLAEGALKTREAGGSRPLAAGALAAGQASSRDAAPVRALRKAPGNPGGEFHVIGGEPKDRPRVRTTSAALSTSSSVPMSRRATTACAGRDSWTTRRSPSQPGVPTATPRAWRGRYRPCKGSGEASGMIRKISSGKYRLYSRKVNPKTGRRRNLGTFSSRAAAMKHERPCSSSSAGAERGPRTTWIT